jgi:prevent-host-death family protein
MPWRLQDAKNQFLKFVQKARTEGPQFVTLSGERAAVVLSAHDYDARCPGDSNLVEDLLSGPVWDGEMSDAVNRRDKTQRNVRDFDDTGVSLIDPWNNMA